MSTVRFADLFAQWEAVDHQSSEDWVEPPPLPDEYRYGFGRSSRFRLVCDQCVDDEALRRFAFTRASTERCDFCGKTSETHSHVNDLFEYVYRSLLREYQDPSGSHLSYDKEEEVWFGAHVLETSDVLYNEDAPLGDGSTLHEPFSSSVLHDWYVVDSEVGTTDQRFVWSWESFKDRLRSGPRFLFDLDSASQGEFSVGDLFSYFDTCAAHLQSELVKVAPPGMTLLRARSDDTSAFHSAVELGPPPAGRAKAGRMSADGEPIFYGSEDGQTAVEETRPRSGAVVTVGHWRSTKPIRYIDLAERLPTPSLFDASRAYTRPFVRFCNAFGREISKPIADDGVPANEYLPTQILTEHLRYRMPTHAGQGVDAIRYPSTFTAEANWAVFVDSDSCGEAGSGSTLELQDVVVSNG